MGRDVPPPTRDERLAARLRENLKRRKAQARAHAALSPAASPEPALLPSAALPKPCPPG